MNCVNCGAPMELFERRRYFFCRHCGTFHFIDTPEQDGVQVLARGAQADPCPVCDAPLSKALLDGHHGIEYCETCRGALLSRGSFVDVTTTRRAFAEGAPVPPQPIDQRELRRRCVCPKCRRDMEVHPYYGPGNIVIDTCATCDVIWLDCGELKQIENAPGKDRGRKFESGEKKVSSSPGLSGAEAPMLIGDGAVSLVDVLADLLSKR